MKLLSITFVPECNLRIADASFVDTNTCTNPGYPDGTTSTQMSLSNGNWLGGSPSIKMRFSTSINWARAIRAVWIQIQEKNVIINFIVQSV